MPHASPVAKVLSFTVFTYVGRISYSTYLWRFPLFIFINHAGRNSTRWPPVRRAGRPHAGGGAVSASFFFVEHPIRQETFFTSFRVRILTVPAAAMVMVAIVLATMPATETYAGGWVRPGGVPAARSTPPFRWRTGTPRSGSSSSVTPRR